DTIHPELRESPQWVVWKYKFRKGKWTKPPFNARTGDYASSKDRSTWSTFDEALAAYEAGGWDGLGFVLSPEDPYTGGDLDHCRDPQTGAIAPWAKSVLAELPGAYLEVSPSGTGLRFVVRAVKPPGECTAPQPGGGKLELYDRG